MWLEAKGKLLSKIIQNITENYSIKDIDRRIINFHHIQAACDTINIRTRYVDIRSLEKGYFQYIQGNSYPH